MKKIIMVLILLNVSLLADFSVKSEQKQSVMIELFSSQGCSSCPAAEAWLNDFVHNPELWTKYIPLSFHVDYWDRLGWEDSYAQEIFTQRQYLYKKHAYVSGVYTPAFVVNAKEWRGWFDTTQTDISLRRASVLFLSLKDKKIYVNYNKEGEFEAHVVLLGFGLEKKILRGENRGKTLKHDFVVLKMQSILMQGSKAQIPLLQTEVEAKRYALVAWVTPKGSLDVLQSVGSWLK